VHPVRGKGPRSYNIVATFFQPDVRTTGRSSPYRSIPPNPRARFLRQTIGITKLVRILDLEDTVEAPTAARARVAGAIAILRAGDAR